ncbi:MAG TPA: hypothetical protein VFS24_10170 [Steroidobacteraceae bacterium]|nr:hypothetical protein [Steroidobacteraceae bacterium]
MFRSTVRPLLACTLLLIAMAIGGIARAATISGTVFEDRNYGGGAGRSLAASGGVGIQGVRVEIYDTSGRLLATRTTDAAGEYSYNYGGQAARLIRIVNSTVESTRTGGSSCTTCVPVQTFRAEAPNGFVQSVQDEVGGRYPDRSDAGPADFAWWATFPNTSATQAAQSWSEVDPNTGSTDLINIDFGFNFDTIVNTRDATNCAVNNGSFPCQGSLRQFIINSNALGGVASLSQNGSGQLDGLTTSLPGGYETSIFMIPNAALTNGVAVITLAGTMPNLTATNTRLDATTQTINIGNTNSGSEGTGGTVGVDAITLPTISRPEVQLNCAASAAPVTLASSNQSIVGFALNQGYVLLSGANGTVRNNLVGMTASGSSAANASAFYGIKFSGTNATVRNNFVTVNNSAIRSDGGASGSVVTLNEVARPSFGHTNTFDGILLIGGASNIQITANLVRNQAGGGIELGFGSASDSYVNITVANNTVTNNGFTSGSTASTEPVGMVAYNLTGTNVVFYRNRSIANGGPGLLIMSATGVSASQNSFGNNGGPAIDLDPNTRDPNTMGAPNGVTLNDNGDADTGPNGLLNYPVITSAVIANGELNVAGFARPNSAIELYLAQPDPSGFGEGQTYVTVLTEGSASDVDATTGTYGPGNINGRAQGTDTTNRFAFRMSVPSGVAIGSILTATATLNGQTSEFGGNVVVTSGPTLVHAKTVAVLSDPLNNTTNPKSIPGAIEVYTVRVTNQGQGAVDNNTLRVIDAIPANTAMYVLDIAGSGSGPVAFSNGSPSSTLTYIYGGLNNGSDGLDFSNDGGATWTYTPIANANGCDPAITNIRVKPQGAMAANTGSGNPYFEIRFRVRVN